MGDIAARPVSPRILLTACQVRAARAMIGISNQELARRAGVGEATLVRMQRGFGLLTLHPTTRERLLAYFEGEGFVFARETGDRRGPGVFWGRYPGRVIA